jgi:endonuclease/exonuclease/phosphatase family metal-dependent hydrolase
MNRRYFLHATGGLIGATLLQPPAFAQSESEKATLRTITYNILACKGYPETDANRELLSRAKVRMTERLALELALYRADIVTFQESPSEAMVADIAKAMGQHYTYFSGGFPGAIITPHRIVGAQNCPLTTGERPPDLFTRHWGRAVLEVNGRRLNLYSAHLHPSNPDVRAREISEALAVMSRDLQGPDAMLFQGDLNHRPDGPEYPRWRDAGLVDAFHRTGDPSELTFPSTTPVQAIDYVWANPVLAKSLRAARVLFEGGFRTNPSDPLSFALSDHLPVFAEFGW